LSLLVGHLSEGLIALIALIALIMAYAPTGGTDLKGAMGSVMRHV
jgi:hypothetical protein